MAKRAGDANAARRSLAASLSRVAAGFALLALLYDWRVIDLGALNILVARPDILALALAASLANIPLEALRWHILLRAQGVELRLWRTIRVFATIVFFANFAGRQPHAENSADAVDSARQILPRLSLLTLGSRDS